MSNAPASTGIPSDIPRPDGLRLQPFPGLRYDAERVGLDRVLAPPYDVIDDVQRKALLDLDSHNVVHLTLPDADEEPGTAYDAAARRLRRWRDEGVLVADRPGLYVYEQTVAGHTQRGILGALELSPAEDGVVLPHENTMAGPVADRLALTEATQANLEPIFLVYDGGGAATDAVAEADRLPIVAEVTTADGRHRLWRIDDADTLQAVATDLAHRRALIADGHHRYATYLSYQRAQHERGLGRGPWDRGLAFLVDSGSFGPEVHAIHRVVPGLALATAVQDARTTFTVTAMSWASAEGADNSPALAELATAAARGPAFLLTDGAGAFLLTDPDPVAMDAAVPAERSAAWRDLHVSVAHSFLFATVWELQDREGVVDFAHDVVEAVERAKATSGVAVLLAPTPVADVAAVAAAGDRMPRKSTLFVPKPATGMVIRSLPDEA